MSNHPPADAAAVVRNLIDRHWHITFAESCTGGLAAAHLVDVPDASKVFDGSFVTYANEAKMRFLGVSAQLIQRHGVVSEAVAGEMAKGAAAAFHAQVGVGISGIAGPGGGSTEKPVGTVCFGFYINGQLTTATCHFGAIGRDAVRTASVEYVYSTLIQHLSQPSN